MWLCRVGQSNGRSVAFVPVRTFVIRRVRTSRSESVVLDSLDNSLLFGTRIESDREAGVAESRREHRR